MSAEPTSLVMRGSGDLLCDWQEELTEQARSIRSWWNGPGPEQQDRDRTSQDGIVVGVDGVWTMSGTMLLGCITFLLNYYSLAVILPEAFSLPFSVLGFVLEINTLLLTSVGLCLTQYYLGSLAHDSYEGAVLLGNKRVLYLIVGTVILLIAIFAVNRTLIFTDGSWSNALAAFMITVIMESGFVMLAGVTDSGFTRPVIKRMIRSSWKLWRLIGQMIKAPFALAGLTLVFTGKLLIAVLEGVRACFRRIAQWMNPNSQAKDPSKAERASSPRNRVQGPAISEASVSERDNEMHAFTDESTVLRGGKETPNA